MREIKICVLAVACAVALSACDNKPSNNKAGLSEETYKSSGVTGVPFHLPAGEKSIYKAYRDFGKDVAPKPFTPPKTWMVYIAAPGWTNGGEPIVDRLSNDGAQVAALRMFVNDNGLADKVKLAWVQYDRNPSPQFVESIDLVPLNFIPLYLTVSGPKVDFYIQSPVSRYGDEPGLVRYDQWLKPYIKHAQKNGDDYVTTSTFHRDQGFNDYKNPYWNSWSRNWFIVNPDGVVVDAYLSNLGVGYTYGARTPINSLIHHLKLDADKLTIFNIQEKSYVSTYTEPFWDQFNNYVQDQLGLKK
jgi:hypothetical protein